MAAKDLRDELCGHALALTLFKFFKLPLMLFAHLLLPTVIRSFWSDLLD